MKRTIAILLFGFVAAVPAIAQGAKPDMKSGASLPTVDQILDKYVKAIGGKEALEKQTSRVTKGTFDIPAVGASGTMEIYEKAPNKNLLAINIPGFGVIQEGFDGTVGWAEEPTSGLREKSGIELEQTKLDWAFHRNTHLKELYPKMTVKGQEKVGERMTYVIEATPAKGSAEKWYFDAENGLLIKMDQERESPLGAVAIEVYLDSYKEMDGVKIPTAQRLVRPDFTINITTEEVKHNVAIDDAKFKKPGS